MNLFLKRVSIFAIMLASGPLTWASDATPRCDGQFRCDSPRGADRYSSPPTLTWRHEVAAENEDVADFPYFAARSRLHRAIPPTAASGFYERVSPPDYRGGRDFSREFQPQSNINPFAGRSGAGLGRSGQTLCPVTGEALGSMGEPIPVTLNGQTVWVCCDACVAGVRRSPEKYLRKVQDDLASSGFFPNRMSEPQYAPAIRNARPAVRWGGQQLCPVTGEALGSMGEPIPVTLNGQTVWVCCQACVAAVRRSPEKYLRKVEDDLASSGSFPNRMPEPQYAPAIRNGRPAVRWGGQQLCPVTGEALGSMGEPIPVTLNGRTVWVCCEACVAAVRRSPDKYFRRDYP